jgi:glycosyltransferase involved in cell wall biosynthesis
MWDSVTGYDLLIAGTGNYENELRVLADGNPRIKFLGTLPQNELGCLYFHAIATIVPSITYETFGMILIESFARKTPVIVRDLGALPEVVADSNGGFVYRTESELLQAIEQLGSSPPLRRRLGENGYDAFLKQWTGNAHLDLYFGYLARISAERPMMRPLL